jgi:hypothetical protein
MIVIYVHSTINRFSTCGCSFTDDKAVIFKEWKWTSRKEKEKETAENKKSKNWFPEIKQNEFFGKILRKTLWW